MFFFHLQNSLGQNKIHPVPYVESNFHPQEGGGNPVKKLSGDSSQGRFFCAQQAEEMAPPRAALAFLLTGSVPFSRVT